MKTAKKVNHADVIKWVNESRLDLPDRWEVIQQKLKYQMPENIRKMDEPASHQQPQLFKGRRLLIAGVGLAVVVLLISMFMFGLWGRWFLQTKNPSDHYQPMASDSVVLDNSNETSKNQTQGTIPDDPALLAFQNRVDEQTKLMDQENIPEKYIYYAGRFIEDQKTFVVAVTCDPEDFIKTYSDILDFNFIQVRQVKYTYKELAAADEQLNEEWIKSDRLVKMGIIGHGVDEENNAVLIVVQDLNDEIRSEIAKYISDTDEIVFEVGGKIIPY